TQAPADRVGLTLENFAGTGDTVAIRGLDATLSLSRTLELGNKASLRGQVAGREQLLVNTRNDIQRLSLLADTAQTFLHVAADQERLHLAEEAIELVRVNQKTVETQIQAGKTPDAERQRLIIDLANHELRLEHRHHELVNARVHLATLWGDKTPDYDRVEADIFSIDALPDLDELDKLLDRNPELVRHTNAEDIARARIRLMQSKRKPDLDVTAGLRYLGGSNDLAFMLSASIPLGSSSRAQPGIDEARAMAQIEPLNLEQRRLELYATLFEIYQEISHAREAVITLKGTIIPAAENMLAEYQTGYQAGRYSLLELIQVRQLLTDARSQLLEMAVNYHSHRIELDRLTGAQLTQW
ncbi:MAG: TolC family protein, partial [Gammaproteobacteria bacterium]